MCFWEIVGVLHNNFWDPKNKRTQLLETVLIVTGNDTSTVKSNKSWRGLKQMKN